MTQYGYMSENLDKLYKYGVITNAEFKRIKARLEMKRKGIKPKIANDWRKI
jgi:hypothetical protein